jgi:hypothetical protein
MKNVLTLLLIASLTAGGSGVANAFGTEIRSRP